jgi:hypothetical protein
MGETRAYLQPIRHTRPCTCQRARCGTGRNLAVDSTVSRGQNQLKHIVIVVLRHTSSGWDGCLSAIAERRRTWWWPRKLDGLTRIPRQIVRVTGRTRVRQIIERDSINPAAFFQSASRPAGRGRVENVFDSEYGDVKDVQGSTPKLHYYFN